ncbi:hypothetical protein T11_13290 [Trichinella zimbabwensis]|uniref:Uncharacterized protein n=1 Tax=Trichinella zimbabwensis TaxID=268475 RepID=A0A0V1GLK5_9BILA|nr:hypothetical protein T11_13290 [Trichinella zimbabwensis]
MGYELYGIVRYCFLFDFRFSNSRIYYLILVICKISLQWHRPLKAVLAYALALRGGGSGLELTLHVLINVA